MDLTCPTCKSENTQKLSLMVQGGTLTTSTNSLGIGAAGRGAVVGVASSKGKSTSQLAKKYEAPEKISVIGAFFAVMVVAVVCALFFGSAAISIGVVVGILASCFALYNNTRDFPREFAEWNAKYICLRCSDVFIPGAPKEVA